MDTLRQPMNVKYLSSLNEGETGVIVLVRGKAETHRYLSGMGLTVGRSISVNKVEITPQDSSFTIIAGDRVTTLGNNIALDIKVQVAR